MRARLAQAEARAWAHSTLAGALFELGMRATLAISTAAQYLSESQNKGCAGETPAVISLCGPLSEFEILKKALALAYNQGWRFGGSYLENITPEQYAATADLWKEFGLGEDSILSFADKLRRGSFTPDRAAPGNTLESRK
jgi:hypothetical protein